MCDAFLQIARETRSSKPSDIAGMLRSGSRILVRQGSVIGKLQVSVEKQAFKYPAWELYRIVSVLFKLAFEVFGTEIMLEFGRH